MPKFLHAHCGSNGKERTTKLFSGPEWEEVRLDPDGGAKPHVRGSLADLSGFEAASFDAVFASRSLERFYAHEVDAALAGCLRVLRPEGYLIIVSADIEEACARVAQGKILEKAYDSPAGPVTPLDILYGFRPALAAGKTGYACNCGFTAQSLAADLGRAGYGAVWAARNPAAFTLAAIASKKKRSGEEMKGLAKEHFG